MTSPGDPLFVLQTCEGLHDPDGSRLPFEAPAADPAPFQLDDPFGLRKAILPVFHCEPGSERIVGLGTAFHVDGWGTFLTAAHVVEPLSEPNGQRTRRSVEVGAASAGTIMLLLGLGLVLGKVEVPSTAWALTTGFKSVRSERDDPLAHLRCEDTQRTDIDLCALDVRFDPLAEIPMSVPIRWEGWQPTVGECVFACGYPQLTPNPVTPEEQQRLIQDGLHGCYGRVTSVGRGEGGDRRECLFEVEADWPPGMSGGPVFNREGHVVGVVSRSTAPDVHHKGVGYAVCLSWVPHIQCLVPRLDSNPGFRFGVAVYRETPWHLAAVRASISEARQKAGLLGPEYDVGLGSHEIGTDGFVFQHSSHGG
jgi:serine protease Do